MCDMLATKILGLCSKMCASLVFCTFISKCIWRAHSLMLLTLFTFKMPGKVSCVIGPVLPHFKLSYDLTNVQSASPHPPCLP